MSDSADLVTTAQVAQIVLRPVSTVNRWARDGRLPVAFKSPTARGANLFHRTAVEALVAELRAKAS